MVTYVKKAFEQRKFNYLKWEPLNGHVIGDFNG